MELDSSMGANHSDHHGLPNPGGPSAYSMTNLLMRREQIVKPTISPALLIAIDQITNAENGMKFSNEMVLPNSF